VLFSYLGRMDQSLSHGRDAARPWTIVFDEELRRVFPDDSEPDLTQPFAIEIIVAVHPSVDGPRFESLWRFSPEVTDEQDIRDLADGWVRAIDALADAAGQ
jgi:hypothetical protein